MAEAGLCELREKELQAIKAVIRPQLARAAELLDSELTPKFLATETPKILQSQIEGIGNNNEESSK